jgi:hypothetical protein
MCHEDFFPFKTVFLRLLQAKSFVKQKDVGLYDTFLLIHSRIQSKLGLKTVIKNRKMLHVQMSKKCQKKCRVLFEWPLIGLIRKFKI